MTCHLRALDQLRDAGIRLTPQRALVLDVVFHSDGHLTADEVYEQVRARSPYVDLSTVYRNLVFLRQIGLVGELRREGQPVRFEAVRSDHEHHHAVCGGCGRMIVVDHADMAALEAVLWSKYGFQLAATHLTLAGLCQECVASAQPGARQPVLRKVATACSTTIAEAGVGRAKRQRSSTPGA